MKQLGLLAVLFIPALVSAAEYVGNAHGIAMVSALQRETFQLASGTLGDCKTSGTQSTYRVCALVNASMTLSNSTGQSQVIPVIKVMISDYATDHGAILRDYIFSGLWADTKVGINDEFSLELHERKAFPGRLWGNLDFHGYHMSYGIEAALD